MGKRRKIYWKIINYRFIYESYIIEDVNNTKIVRLEGDRAKGQFRPHYFRVTENSQPAKVLE